MKNPLFLLLAVVSPLFSDVTPEAVDALPAAERAEWKAYLERSRAAAELDERALRRELESLGLEKPLPARSGEDFKVRDEAGSPRFAGKEAASLADVLISWQTPAGGWSKHNGYSQGSREPGMLWSSQYAPGHPPHYLGTIDNHATTAEITFLARVWLATKRDDCRDAVRRGLRYLLDARYPNGGWP